MDSYVWPAIGGLAAALLGLYIWSFALVQGLRKDMNDHMNQSNRHPNAKDLVYRDVCSIQIKRVEEQIATVNDKVEGVKEEVVKTHDLLKLGFDEIKGLIRGGS